MSKEFKAALATILTSLFMAGVYGLFQMAFKQVHQEEQLQSLKEDIAELKSLQRYYHGEPPREVPK